ncbi:MAG TPA: GNAT family N-acetyltransferase [Blastocatellia bacterium]|nr:GNAT family N-acetyltransferase [Blastocatellia bacterium]HMX30392.1 GNAT family N-acetyltransferase [Blastocatellia bacterium]HMY76403.1 GNAT family N-acetyltransferase [Blastocatellia bacterium]HMZ22681.1 GNAT family N-acetyltransferase [Blastocatellia bacterium]
MKITLLSTEHDRSQFDCGEPALNEYLKFYAGQHARKDQSRTYVATDDNGNRVWGYYTLSSSSVGFNIVPEKLPRHPIPTALLGRLAIDLEKRGQGLGSVLLADALKRVVAVSDHVAVYAVVVDALHDQAKQFYLHFGFRELLDDSLHLFLPLREAKKLCAAL